MAQYATHTVFVRDIRHTRNLLDNCVVTRPIAAIAKPTVPLAEQRSADCGIFCDYPLGPVIASFFSIGLYLDMDYVGHHCIPGAEGVSAIPAYI